MLLPFPLCNAWDHFQVPAPDSSFFSMKNPVGNTAQLIEFLPWRVRSGLHSLFRAYILAKLWSWWAVGEHESSQNVSLSFTIFPNLSLNNWKEDKKD